MNACDPLLRQATMVGHTPNRSITTQRWTLTSPSPAFCCSQTRTNAEAKNDKIQLT